LTDVASFEGDISTLVRQSAVAQTSLSAVRQDVRQMESGLIGRLDSVLLQLQKMAQESREMSSATASAWIPAPWAPSDQSFEEVLPHVEKVETTDSGEGQKTLTEFRRCACAKILCRQTKSLWTSTWSLSWSDSATSHHLKTCQYWNPYQEVWTTKLSVFHVNLLAAMALSASIRISKQAGIFSISPSLTLRGVVNESSPAFALLKDLRKLYRSKRSSPYRVSTSKLEKQTSLVTRSILRLLKEEAVSPYEVDKNGWTLLHNALSCAYDQYLLDEVPAFRELIHTLLDAGVAINEVNLAGETALDHLISNFQVFIPHGSRGNSVCEFLANKGAEMSDVLLTRSGVSGFRISVELQNAAMLEAWQDATQCGPLSLAVLRQSEQDVIRILRVKPSSIRELNRRKQSPLHLACRWPRGIQLLLDAGANYLVHQADVCGSLPIAYSALFYCLDAIQLLLNAGSAFSSPGWTPNWEEVLDILLCEKTIPSFLLSTFQERRRKLFELAKRTLPAEVWADLDVPTDRLLDERAAEIQRVLVDADIEIPKSISVPQARGTVYHGPIQSAKQADQLWDAGFKDIDSWDEFGRTPMMNSESYFEMDYSQWLLHHGADPHREIRYIHDDNDDKRKSVAGFTALHCVAYQLGLHLMRFLLPKAPPALLVVDEPSLTFEELLVKGGWHDDCHCACSSSGCTPFTTLLKAINHENIRSCRATSEKPSELRRLVVHHLESPGHPASSALMRSKIVENVIRFETFEALQLSHTCCNFHTRGAYRRYTPKDVREIHEDWEELLSKHENLVSQFCHKFQELGGTLMSFLKGYWQTRMEEVLREEKPLDEESIHRLREIGVVLKEVSEEAEEDFTDEGVTDGGYGEGYNEGEHDQGIQAKENGGSDVGSETEYASARSESSEQEAGG
jgi:ankyrin repeat protein